MKQKGYARVSSLSVSSGRVIIVGDIHGCNRELQELLRIVSFDKKSDTLVTVGDLVNKGPDSFGVVRFLQQLGAYNVLGNHDLKLLKLVKKLEKHGTLKEKDRKSSMASLAASAPHDVTAYLSGLPHILRIPAHNVIVVHAGLHPQRLLEKQVVKEVTTMRNLIERDCTGTTDEVTGETGITLTATEETTKGGVPWASLWGGPETVVFGHDARRGLQEEYRPFAIGIDSRCVYGGRLSAVVYPGGEIVSVPGWCGAPKV
ncbi:Calcineurin like phosphoesterase superfamily domain [Trypanosoma vivax]|uniref:Putative diadenosine tetraphosphatase n=1 Tax=Trypanosoma vivax (strain Y486) TaxID=1055687 RepID=G0TZU6_TRYVY|nr:putative diadenosine tetraphosphatase [Trypanosoma vivax]KAH8617726.1 Calcineurin like phosphoesterase superfamily domain [Trypanosoma vivax]CCC50124.1 putative diadenosine tetraphosphatase [Trypanosoma vivax Y486]